jgi:hypothetical protein
MDIDLAVIVGAVGLAVSCLTLLTGSLELTKTARMRALLVKDLEVYNGLPMENEVRPFLAAVISRRSAQLTERLGRPFQPFLLRSHHLLLSFGMSTLGLAMGLGAAHGLLEWNEGDVAADFGKLWASRNDQQLTWPAVVYTLSFVSLFSLIAYGLLTLARKLMEKEDRSILENAGIEVFQLVNFFSRYVEANERRAKLESLIDPPVIHDEAARLARQANLEALLAAAEEKREAGNDTPRKQEQSPAGSEGL